MDSDVFLDKTFFLPRQLFKLCRMQYVFMSAQLTDSKETGSATYHMGES